VLSLPAGLLRVVRFAAVGAVGTAAHYALLLALVEGFGAAPLAGSAAGFGLGAVVNYGLGRLFVFRSGRPHREALPRFFVVALAGLGWNALLMALLTALGLHYLVAQILTTAALLLWHYGAHAVWTFRRDSAADAIRVEGEN
jgi:putative flippase GtrA